MPMEPAAYAFQLDGKPVKCEVFGHGHINHTLKLTTDTGAEYVLQQINTYDFKKDTDALTRKAKAVQAGNGIVEIAEKWFGA